MVDQYFTEIFDICDQSTIPIHVLKCRMILKNAGNLQCSFKIKFIQFDIYEPKIIICHSV